MSTVYTFPVILIISKDAAKITLLKRALEGSFHIITIEDADEALEMMRGMSINIVLIDEQNLKVPIVGLCKQMRKITGYKNIPILLISNNLKKTFILEALSAGVSDFLNEPLDPMEVYQRVVVTLKFHGPQKKVSMVASRFKPSTATKGLSVFQGKFLLNDLALKTISKAKKEGSFLSLLMVEIDSFEQLLNQWGELISEELVLATTGLLNRLLRKYDVMIPQGGGRFILVLPKTSRQAALAIAEMIRKEVNAATFKTKKTGLSLTVSIGVVAIDKTGTKKEPYEHFERLLETVTHYLGEAKKKGNQIISH